MFVHIGLDTERKTFPYKYMLFWNHCCTTSIF